MLKKISLWLLAWLVLCAFAACSNQAVTPDNTDSVDATQTADNAVPTDSVDPTYAAETPDNADATDGSSAAPTDSVDPTAPAETPDDVVDYTGYTDEEFLAGVHSWQNKDAPGVIYILNEDGTGELTVDNERHVYEMAWFLEDGMLKFEMQNWPYINDEQFYEIFIDKETLSFMTRNPDSGSEAIFVPLGTVPFPTYEDNKPEELLGFWVMTGNPEATGVRVWLLNPKTERSGYGVYYPEEKQLTVQHYFDDWNMIGDDSLAFVMENGTVSTKLFALENDVLNLISDNTAFERLDVTGVEINK